MFRSYWNTAFRLLIKNKTFSAINVLGLTPGSVCCLYIVLYVRPFRPPGDRHRSF
jgi:putative ABC transport system permease protein